MVHTHRLILERVYAESIGQALSKLNFMSKLNFSELITGSNPVPATNNHKHGGMMCLYTLQGKALIAEKDLLVFKRLKRMSDFTGVSVLYNHYYKVGELQPKVRLCPAYSYNAKRFSKGYHSFSYRPHSSYPYRASVAEFIIPKGSRYYIGDDGDVVSNQIIFKGWVGRGRPAKYEFKG